MSTLIAAVALACLSTGCAITSTAVVVRTVDLDRPGAFKALQQANPVHSVKVQKIIDRVVHQPDTVVPRWMEATFGARGIEYAPVILTSHPPQQRLSFVLDDTRYVTTLRMPRVRGEITPAK